MLIVHVFVHVNPHRVDDFIAATLENARNSVQEPGVVRFDLVQQDEDPTRFLLIEIYRTPQDPSRHKETAHYAKWRDTGRIVDGRTAAEREVSRAVSRRRGEWERKG
jgi:quinol monooxygenase YgiN